MGYAPFFAVLLIVGATATAAAAQSVPEGTHTLATGPQTICGITASSVHEFRSKVEGSGLERQDGGPRFDAFISDMGESGMTQWVFTKPSETAYPAVTCRHVFKAKNGDWMMDRNMRCDASRAACDALFIEFQKLDEQARRATAQAAQ
jgi:hypothetical protein